MNIYLQMLDIMGPEIPAWGKGIRKGRQVLVRHEASARTSGGDKPAVGGKGSHHDAEIESRHGKVGFGGRIVISLVGDHPLRGELRIGPISFFVVVLSAWKRGNRKLQ